MPANGNETMLERLERIETRLDGVEVRLDRVEVRLDRVDTKIDGLSTDVKELGNRVGRVEVQLEDMTDTLNKFTSQWARGSMRSTAV